MCVSVWWEGGSSLHCVCTADSARARPESIFVMDTLAQCITLITLASHFSSMKPSSGLTATGCTLGQPPPRPSPLPTEIKESAYLREKRRTEVIRDSHMALWCVTLSRLRFLLCFVCCFFSNMSKCVVQHEPSHNTSSTPRQALCKEVLFSRQIDLQ